MKFQVYRPGQTIQYGANFSVKEKKALSRIPNLQYITGPQKVSSSLPLILLSNTQTKYDFFPSSLYDKIQLIVHPNSGLDNFPLEFVQKAPFPIIYGPQLRANAVADYILSCVYHRFSPIPSAKRWDKERNFPRSLLNSQEVLLIGYGHVGKLVHQSLAPKVKGVTVYDPFKGYKKDPKGKFDILILAASLNPTSKEMVNHRLLSLLNNNALIINAARGGLVEDKSLIHFLEKRPHAFAYLDVFHNEPQGFKDYKGIANVNLTSHIAGIYDDLGNSIIEFEYEVISDYIKMNSRKKDFLKKYDAINMKNRCTKKFII